MDFVARAGAIIDRAHRIAGFLLICCVILAVLTMCQLQKNDELNSIMIAQSQRLPVIVVPGAVAGKYDPREDAQLIAAFADFITQTFNTFTPETLKRQMESVAPYFAPALLVDSAPYFEKKINDATSVKRASLFIPDRSTLTSKAYQRNGIEFRDVKLQGMLQNIAGGTVAENVPLEITMTLQKTIINPAINPYGFQLVTYHEKPLVDPRSRPTLPDIDTGQPASDASAPMESQ